MAPGSGSVPAAVSGRCPQHREISVSALRTLRVHCDRSRLTPKPIVRIKSGTGRHLCERDVPIGDIRPDFKMPRRAMRTRTKHALETDKKNGSNHLTPTVPSPSLVLRISNFCRSFRSPLPLIRLGGGGQKKQGFDAPVFGCRGEPLPQRKSVGQRGCDRLRSRAVAMLRQLLVGAAVSACNIVIHALITVAVVSVARMARMVGTKIRVAPPGCF